MALSTLTLLLQPLPTKSPASNNTTTNTHTHTNSYTQTSTQTPASNNTDTYTSTPTPQQKASTLRPSPPTSQTPGPPIPKILITPPSPTSTPPYTPNLDHETTRPNALTRNRNPPNKTQNNRSHLRPRLPAIKPRTAAYQNLQHEQTLQRQKQNAQKLGEKCRWRKERVGRRKGAGVVSERAYYRLQRGKRGWGGFWRGGWGRGRGRGRGRRWKVGI